MNKVRLGLIGIGNMGGDYVARHCHANPEKFELTAICDIRQDRIDAAREKLGNPDFPAFLNSDDLINSGLVDAVIIATPHYDHPKIAIKAFEAGLHVLSEKPIGVYTKIVREEMEAAERSGKVFGVMYNQRTTPAYRKLREMIQSGELGEMKRAVWFATGWYRTQAYYDSGDWRATWAGEGGGVLLNQCPHHLDLMQWLCGVPKRVHASAYYGKYHDIEVEDDVTAFFEYENGATGLFITTTGEWPGATRFEFTGTKGTVIAEAHKLTITRVIDDTDVFLKESDGGFAKPRLAEPEVIEFPGAKGHPEVLENFVDAILYGTPLLSPGNEGINGLTVSNAIHLSSWTNDWVDVPFDEDKFYNMLQEKINNSTIVKKAATGKVEDLSNTYGN